jgi:hypothetical protein
MRTIFWVDPKQKPSLSVEPDIVEYEVQVLIEKEEEDLETVRIQLKP